MPVFQNLEKYVPGLRLVRALRTAYPIITTSTLTYGGVPIGATTNLASAATVTVPLTSSIINHTPTQNETINFPSAAGAIGVDLFLIITTSGVTSFTLTFGTNAKSQGTLATGTTSGATFLVEFTSNGTNWVECGRTIAM